MARLPKPGSDQGKWGEILNEYLSVAHDDNGNLKDNTVAESNLTPEVIEKLHTAGVSSVAALTGDITSLDLVEALETDLRLHYAPVAGSNLTVSGTDSWAEGQGTTASGNISHAEGRGSIASGHSSHAEGYQTTASSSSPGAHSEGCQTAASNFGAHAEGASTIASGFADHAEGNQTTASGANSHAEGDRTTASGQSSHAEGYLTTASGLSPGAHAEGANTIASAYTAHAEGSSTVANATSSHAEGYQTTAFRYAESTRGYVDQVQQALIAASSGAASQTAVTYVAASGVVTIPVHGGVTSGKIVILTEDGAIRWDVTFSAKNNAATYATRATGTVSILASVGTASTTYGTSAITWTVSGNATGQVVITPSATPASPPRLVRAATARVCSSNKASLDQLAKGCPLSGARPGYANDTLCFIDAAGR